MGIYPLSRSFNSLNEVSSKFIDVANGDSQKYADLVSNFDEHVRELRESWAVYIADCCA
jgi:hypothetical protein